MAVSTLPGFTLLVAAVAAVVVGPFSFLPVCVGKPLKVDEMVSRTCPGPSTSIVQPAHSSASVALAPLLSTSLVANNGAHSTSSKPTIAFDRNSLVGDWESYHFLHISKCSGASFIKWAIDPSNTRSNGKATFPRFSPKQAQGSEYGNVYDAKRGKRVPNVRMTMLRSPRAHVMSLFKECRFDEWGKQQIKRMTAQGKLAVPHNGTHLEDFTRWIDYFLAGNDTYVRARVRCFVRSVSGLFSFDSS